MAICISPKQFKPDSGLLPCGNCFTCKRNKQKEWLTRLLLEALHSKNHVIFGTLTYDEEHLPLKAKYPGGSLNKKDAQNFIKRLRSNYYYKYPETKETLRYFIVGEYGTETHRAHYHFLLFGTKPEHNSEQIIKNSWKLSPPERIDCQVIGERSLLKSAVKTFSGQTYSKSILTDIIKSIRYTAKYILKSEGLDSEDEREQEFSLKSSRPPLGTLYFDKMLPKLKEQNLYPILGLPTFHKFLFEKYYLPKHPDYKIWDGSFMLFADSGSISYEITDYQIKHIKQFQGITLKLDRSMQTKLLDKLEPSLQLKLHKIYSSKGPAETKMLHTHFRHWQDNKAREFFKQQLIAIQNKLDNNPSETLMTFLHKQQAKMERLINASTPKL